MNNFPCNTNKAIEEKKRISSEKCWIERPRYFSGQLLTDADLRTEQRYVIEKNKLQNRYLHGWGVVCGLKVKCFPCCTGHGSSGKVVVEPGYAIDCCGNDIVVCDEQEYNVVKRINELIKKKKAESDPCGPTVVVEETPCDKAEDKYYLTISYKKVDAKPATAMKAKNACSIQSCVPSRTKECFELDLIKYCTLNKRIEDNFFARAKQCFTVFLDTWKRVFDEETITIQGKTAEQIKNFIREYYKTQPSHVRCAILDEIETTGEEKYLFTTKTGGFDFTTGLVTDKTKNTFKACNHPLTDAAVISQVDEKKCEISDGDTTYRIEILNAKSNVYRIQKDGLSVVQLYLIVFYLLLDCICQALLNPCPECTEDDVVILATITVRNKKIDRICNFSRKWVMTFPTLFYWLPINEWIGRAVKYICCELDLKLSGNYAVAAASGHVASKTLHGHGNPGYGDLPLWMYMTRIVENNFAVPNLMAKNLEMTAKIIPDTMFKILDPANVSLETAMNIKPEESEARLKKLGINVERTETYELSVRDFSLENIISAIPVARPGDKVIQLVKDDRVVGFRVAKAAEAPSEKEIFELRKDLHKIETDIEMMKSHMRRDTDSVIETKLRIEKKYRPLTMEITRSLLEEIPVEKLVDVGDVRGAEMRKVKIKSVRDVLEAVPAKVSDAVKEPMSNAVKYVDNAEEYAVEVAKLIGEEMQAKDVKNKADLVELDAKKIANKLKISERTVEKAIKINQ